MTEGDEERNRYACAVWGSERTASGPLSWELGCDEADPTWGVLEWKGALLRVGSPTGRPNMCLGNSIGTQMVKSLPAVQETWVQSLGREDSLEKEMATLSSTLAWKIPWTEEPGRLHSMGLHRVGQDWATEQAGRLRKKVEVWGWRITIFTGWICPLVGIYLGFSDGSAGKESTCNARDPSLFPKLGGFPGECIDYPFQYFGVSLVTQMVKKTIIQKMHSPLWSQWHYSQQPKHGSNLSVYQQMNA